MKATLFTVLFSTFFWQCLTGQEVDTTSIMDVLSRAQQYIGAGQFSEGNQLLTKAGVALQDHEDTAELARYHSILGFALEMQGKKKLAVEAYEHGLKIRRKRKEYTDQAKLLIAISKVKGQLRDDGSALGYARQAIEIAQERGISGFVAGDAYMRQAVALRNSNQYAEAREAYGKAQEIFERIGDRDGLGLVTYNLGELFFLAEETDSARIYSEIAQKYAADSDNESLSAKIAGLSAALAFSRNHFAEARKRYLESERLALRSRDSALLSDLYLNLSLTELYDRNFDEARRYQQKAIDYANHMIGLDDYKTLLQMTGVILSHIKEGEELNQKRRIIQFLLIACALLAMGGTFFYFKIREKQRNKEHLLILQKRELLHRQEIDTMLTEFRVKTMQERLQGEEEERCRVAKVLHDTVGSQLAATKWLYEENIEEFKKNNLQLPDLVNVYKMLIKGHQCLQQATSELKKEDDLWIEEIRSFCQHITKKENFTADLHYEVSGPSVSPNVGEELKNMVLTLGSNVLKHAQASRLLVGIRVLHEKVETIIQDDGIGFDPLTVVKGDGLVNVDRRVRKLNGSWKIDSKQKVGTTVYLTLPIRQQQSTEQQVFDSVAG